MKKIITLVLVLALALVLAACMGGGSGDGGGTGDTNQPPAPPANGGGTVADGGAATGGEVVPTRQLPPLNTTDDITITFSTWHYQELAQYVADRFTDRHPNINIEVILIPGTAYYTDTLMSLAAAGDMPDLWGFLGLATPVNNGWFYDFSDFWFNDPDYHQLLDSLHHHVLVDGRAVRFPEGVLPQLVYLDRNVFNLLNEPMPRFDWTWDEMLELIPRMTRPDMGIFGYNMFLGFVTWGPVVLTDGLSEFGWDGERLNMGVWADSFVQQAEFERLGYRAISGTDEWEALTGDRYMWPGYSGLVAMQLDAIWTFNNLYVRPHIRERGIDMVPYAIPMGRDAQTNRRPAFIDFAGMSAATEHPREAYEALRWMTWYTDAWHYRNYISPQLVNEAGDQIHVTPNRIPLTNDEAVWAGFRELFPMDEPAWDYFLAASREPVPLGGQGILGFSEWISEMYHYGDFSGVIGIYAAVNQGVITPHDVIQQLEDSMAEFHARAIANFRLMYGNP